MAPGRRIAIMQPYFFPYAGYFRLLAYADYFVMLDCVQFNRRGRVHRTQVPGRADGVEWLTLPLKHQPRDVLIRDLAFAVDARALFDQRLERHRWLTFGTGSAGDRIRTYLYGPLVSVSDFLEAGLRIAADILDLRPVILHSSALGICPELRGQDRIIAIVHALHGTEYINSPGGRHLYDRAAFREAGLGLSFLPPYAGCYPLLLPALVSTEPSAIYSDILRTLQACA